MQNLTDREREILKMIEADPLIQQKDISQKINITRSSVAVHIANLSAKGYIKGKGYVLNHKRSPHICVIGGINMDIAGMSSLRASMGDSNVGSVEMSPGGVGRNIAENIARLASEDEVDIYLLSALGDDDYAQMIEQHNALAGINMRHCKKVEGAKSASYLSILDANGEMICAINDMKIVDEIDLAYIQSKRQLLLDSELILIDCNLGQDVIDYIFKQFAHIPIFVDPVSNTKCQKIKAHLDKVHSMTPNMSEASAITGLKGDHKQIAAHLVEQGVKHCYITLGEQGVYYHGADDFAHKFDGLKGDIVNVTGAGDAFIGAIAFGDFAKMKLPEKIEFAQHAALQTAGSKDSNFKQLSKSNILAKMKAK